MSKSIDGVVLRMGADSGALQSGLRKASASIDTFGGRAKAVMGRIGASIKSSSDRLLTPMTAVLTGGGALLAVKDYAGIELAFQRLGNQANMTDEQIASLKTRTRAAVGTTGQDIADLVGGLDKFIEQTGDGETAVDIMETVGIAATATGARVDNLNAVAAQLSSKFKASSDEIGGLLEVFTVQGKAGAFTLNDLANNGERLMAAAGMIGITKAQLNSYGAFMQISRMATGSSEQATTAIEATFREILQKEKELKKVGKGGLGFNIRETSGELKSIEDILKGIVIAAKGDSSKLISAGFGSESSRALGQLAKVYRDSGNSFELFDKLRDSSKDPQKMIEIMRDFNRTMGTTSMKLKVAKSMFYDLTLTNLEGPVNKLNSALDFLIKNQDIAKAGFYAMTAAASALIAVKIGSWGYEAVKFGKELYGFSRGRGVTNTKGITGSMSGIGSIQQVYVTNWHMMGQTQGMTSYLNPQRQAQGMREFSGEVSRSTGSLGKMRGKMNTTFGGTVGVSALAIATEWAIGKIYEAGNLIWEWHKDKSNAEKNTKLQQAENRKAMEKRGSSATYWSDQIDAAVLEKQQIENSFSRAFFGTGDGRLKVLDDNISLYTRLMREATARNAVQQSESSGVKAPDQTIQIYVDAEKRRAVVESTGGYDGPNKLRVNTMPWSGSPVQ